MRSSCLWTSLGLAVLAVAGCGEDNSAAPSEPFELDGAWLYLGPSDAPHILTISNENMVYSAVDGDWSSTWSIEGYDNELHNFQVNFGSGSGSYLPLGESSSGAYELSVALTVQLTPGLSAYPTVHDAGTCTDSASGTPVPDCRLYIKQ
jgi:hypothetical protein